MLIFREELCLLIVKTSKINLFLTAFVMLKAEYRSMAIILLAVNPDFCLQYYRE